MNETVEEYDIMRDVRNNPVKWLLSLMVIGPGLVYTLSGKTSIEHAMDSWSLPGWSEFLFLISVPGQLIIVPLSCYILDRRRDFSSALFIAVCGTSILVANPNEITDFVTIFGSLSFLLYVGLSTPFVLVLRNKKRQLNPGSSRLILSTLFATTIMLYTFAAFGGDSLPYKYRYALMGCTAMAIGWAWPKGRHLSNSE